MISMKKTAIATALGFAMISGATQAAMTNFTFTGTFLMYDGTDPVNQAQFTSYVFNGNLGTGSFANTTTSPGIMDNGNGVAGDPISGTMSIDMSNGNGSATMVGTPFFGSSWNAENIIFTGIGPGLEHATMLFNWGPSTLPGNLNGAPDANGNPTELALTPCGLANCGIDVAVNFQMGMPDANGNIPFFTTASWMLAGPFAGAQPTFSGVATMVPAAVPVPAAAWLLGSGLLGLVGVARRKVAVA